MKPKPSDDGPPYGIYDTIDDLWIGIGKGGPPVQFDTRWMCEQICRKVEIQFGLHSGRMQPRTFSGVDRIRDHIHAPTLKLHTEEP